MIDWRREDDDIRWSDAEKVKMKKDEEGEGQLDMLDAEWQEHGVAYYAVNTVHIGMRAAGEEITAALPLQPLQLCPFSLRANMYTEPRPY